MDTPSLLMQAISGFIAVENDSGLLLALAILNDSAPMAEYTLLNGTLFDLPGILTIKNLSIYLSIPLDVAYVASKAYNANFMYVHIKNTATGSPMKNESTQPQIDPTRLPNKGLDLFL